MRLILDRIEENESGLKIAVFEAGESFAYVAENNMPSGLIDKLTDGLILEADYSNGIIYSAIPLIEETEEKKRKMKNRLSSLFNRNKK